MKGSIQLIAIVGSLLIASTVSAQTLAAVESEACCINEQVVSDLFSDLTGSSDQLARGANSGAGMSQMALAANYNCGNEAQGCAYHCRQAESECNYMSALCGKGDQGYCPWWCQPIHDWSCRRAITRCDNAWRRWQNCRR